MQRSTNRFVDEQAAKRAEIERAKDEQIAKLKALNSPLPSGPAQGLVPEIPSYTKAPQKSSAQSRSSPMRGMSELQRLVNENSADSTQEDTSNDNRQSYQPQIKNSISNAPPPPPQRNVGNNRFSFNANNLGRPNSQQKPPSPKSSPSPPQPRKVVRQALPDVDEDEEFEAFSRNGPNKHMSIRDALRNGTGESDGNNSRGDQENKSKMWGVDMSRFN
jgi:hypothetical protein